MRWTRKSKQGKKLGQQIRERKEQSNECNRKKGKEIFADQNSMAVYVAFPSDFYIIYNNAGNSVNRAGVYKF